MFFICLKVLRVETEDLQKDIEESQKRLEAEKDDFLEKEVTVLHTRFEFSISLVKVHNNNFRNLLYLALQYALVVHTDESNKIFWVWLSESFF